MKKIFLVLSLSLILTPAVMADGNAFTPLDFGDNYSTKTIPNTASYTSNVNQVVEEAIGNNNIQNAISQLDNAQVDIRNELLNYKTKFADIDAQYKLVKAERASLKKQTKAIEKRIREIDKAKEKIRKNML